MEEFLRAWLFNPTVGKIVTAIVGLVVIAAVVRILERSMARYVPRPETRYRARKLINLFGYLTAFLFLGIVFSARLGQFTVAFGVAGAGIAFALQEVIASVAGWVALSSGGFYKTGDRIQLGDTKGDVIDIGILRTTLMECGQWVNGDLYNGRIVRVANSYVFKDPVVNYSADFPFLWDEIMLPIKYGSDYRTAKEIIARVAQEVVGEYAIGARLAWKDVVRKFMIEDAQVEPMITMTANQNWIEFTLRYVVDYKMRRSTKDQLFTRILEEIDATHDRVGIAASTLNIEKVPPLSVTVEGANRAGASSATT
jgi:small-conductance mechanosensitive channel